MDYGITVSGHSSVVSVVHHPTVVTYYYCVLNPAINIQVVYCVPNTPNKVVNCVVTLV